MKKEVICAYPWVPSVQLLPWLGQVLFSHPLTFASVLSHPKKSKEEIFIKPVRTSLEGGSVQDCSYNYILYMASRLVSSTPDQAVLV